MTVIRPNSVSGITSITAQANEINVFRSNGLLAGLNLNGVNFNTTAGISTLAALKITGNLDIAGVLTYQDVTNVDSIGIITARSGINVSGGQLDVGSNIKLGNAGVITATSFVGDGSNLTGISGTSDKIEEGDSLVEVVDTGTGRVAIKADGSHVARFATENGNRTYVVIGNNVAVGNNYGSNAGNVIIASNTTTRTATLRIFTTGVGLSDDTVTGIIDFAAQQSGTGGQTVSKIESSLRGGVENKSDLIFSTSNAGSPTEKLRITSDGKVGVGTDTFIDGNTKFEVRGKTSNTSAGAQNIHKYGSASAFHYGQYNSTGDASLNNQANAIIAFATNNTERARISSNGQLQISPAGAVKMSFYHDSGGSLNHITSNNGNEIKVSSGNGDSNGIEFWDYTGTNKRCQIDGHGLKFNADTAQANALDDYEEGSFTPGTPSYSSSSATGQYTKIGNTVHYQVQITGISGSASFIINNLPFTVDYGWGGTIGITNHGGQDHYYTFPHQGMSQIYVRNSNNSTYGTGSLGGKFFYIWGTYITNS